MQKETISTQKIENDYEQQENKIGRTPEQILKGIEKNSDIENESLNEVTERIQNDNPKIHQESIESEIFDSLGKKIKKNKLLRAALVGLSLCSVNPAFASELEGALSKSETIESTGKSQEKSPETNQFESLPESRRNDFEQIFASAPQGSKKNNSN